MKHITDKTNKQIYSDKLLMQLFSTLMNLSLSCIWKVEHKFLPRVFLFAFANQSPQKIKSLSAGVFLLLRSMTTDLIHPAQHSKKSKFRVRNVQTSLSICFVFSKSMPPVLEKNIETTLEYEIIRFFPFRMLVVISCTVFGNCMVFLHNMTMFFFPVLLLGQSLNDAGQIWKILMMLQMS